MSNRLKVSMLQFEVTDKFDFNLKKVESLLSKAENSDIILLPEMWSLMVNDQRGEEKVSFALKYHDKILEIMKTWAKKHACLLLGGSIFAPSPNGKKVFNRSYLISEQGEVLAKYDKIHLFDNELNTENPYMESNCIEAGEGIVTYIHGKAHFGLSVCYDLRFPYLYAELRDKGANIIFVPSAFTDKTGEAHWETLLRARSIENQCYIIATNQTGGEKVGLPCYGNSMVVDPWGKIMTRAGKEEGVLETVIDLNLVNTIRAKMPVFKHKRALSH